MFEVVKLLASETRHYSILQFPSINVDILTLHLEQLSPSIVKCPLVVLTYQPSLIVNPFGHPDLHFQSEYSGSLICCRTVRSRAFVRLELGQGMVAHLELIQVVFVI